MKRLSTLVLAVVLFASGTVHAVEPLVDGEDFRLELGGYVSAFSGVQKLSYDLPVETTDPAGIGASVFRLEWYAGIGDNVTLTVHDRFFWSLSNAGGLGGSQVGLGATTPPQRTVDLRSTFIDRDGLRFEHDLDRLAVNVYTPAVDLTLGRQAVTWGVASIFPVADIWTQFSPFELDTSQKRGVDAVRGLMYPAEGLELELLVVDRGSLEDLSGGARLAWSSDIADHYASVAKSYERLWAMMGTAADLDYFRPYVELGLPMTADERFELELPHLTVGTGYLRSDYSISIEYHLNGYGVDDAAAYLDEFTAPEVQRGEQYLLGRHYAGAAVTYMLREDLNLALASLVNLRDPSTILTPTFDYEVAQNTRLKAGAYIGLGDGPDFRFGLPQVDSEFGLYSQFYFIELSAFF